MDFASAKKEYARLKKLIDYHNTLYHTHDAPEITDQEFDALVQQKKKLEEKYPDLIDKAAEKPGAAVLSGFKKVNHTSPMLSLDNAFEEKDLEDFFARANRFLGRPQSEPFSCVAEPKIDGLSASLIYQDGKLITVATRGDGSVGEDITENAKTIQDIPHFLDPVPKGRYEVRGEIYMRISDFEALNQKREADGEQTFANPRNASAGSVRQLDPGVTASRKLHFFAYQVLAEHSVFTTHMERLSDLSRLGFQVNPHIKLCHNVSDLMSFYQGMEKERDQLDFEIDGCVYKMNELSLQDRLGFIGKAPRFAIAHKFKALKAQSVIENVIFQVGRVGTITPVACLRPTLVGGVIVSRSTLHNFDEIARKDIRIGDHVWIQRAGDVIPQVVEVIFEKRPSDSKPIQMPAHCPDCGAMLEQDRAQLFCPNTYGCPTQQIQRLIHFVSKDAFDIVGIGDRLIEEFFRDGLVRTPQDLFTFDERDKKSITPLRLREGFGKQSAENLFNAINSRRSIALKRFIYALGIPQVGSVLSDILAKHYRTFAAFRQAMQSLAVGDNFVKEDLLSIEGLGERILQDIQAYFSHPNNQTMIEELSKHLVIEDVQAQEIQQTGLTGKKILFTGTLTISRQEAKELSLRAGAKVLSSLSKETDYLVVGADAGSKLKKASELGVTVLSEDEWRQILKGD